jgi:hypothetical protein
LAFLESVLAGAGAAGLDFALSAWAAAGAGAAAAGAETEGAAWGAVDGVAGAVSAARSGPAIPKAIRAVEKILRKGDTLSELGLMYMKSGAENNIPPPIPPISGA